MDRLFIAAPVGVEQRAGILQHKAALQRKLSFQKWVHPEDLHITIKFLGDSERNTTEQIKALLRELASVHSPFTLGLNKLGVFGKPSSPSILWIGLEGELSVLSSLQAQVETGVELLSFAREERSYSPHITLARRYQGTQPISKELLTDAYLEIASIPRQWTVEQLVLYRSHLNRQPMYEPLEVFSLAAK
jgi:2'-5' RNA ligase